MQQALSNRRERRRLEAMDTTMPDVCIFVPDIWVEPLINPPDHTPSPDVTQAVACPECRRTFQ